MTETLRLGGAPGSSLPLDAAYLVLPDAESEFFAAVERLTRELAARGLTALTPSPRSPGGATG